MNIKTFTFGPFQENTYILYDDEKEGIVVDPGCYEKSEQHELTSFVEENNINISMVINTHCHIDHVLGNDFIKHHFQAPLAIPKGETEVLKAVASYATAYGFPAYKEAEVDQYLEETGSIEFGSIKLNILFVPGHAPGHLAFYDADSKICLGGDVLFRESIGRTDLPGGDYETLINSIHKQMFSLPDEVVVYCGHGPTTTIGHEKISNPFCALA